MKRLLMLAILVPVLPASALAQQVNLPQEGKYDVMSCWSGTQTMVELSKDASVQTSDTVGTNRAATPGTLLDMTTFRCIGSGMTVNGKYSGQDVCEAIDRDGDKIITRFVGEGGKETVAMAIGTGKYEGITRKGQTEPVGTFPQVKPGAVQGCNHTTGTYVLSAKPEASGSSTPPAK
jgi:hypothetical protein